MLKFFADTNNAMIFMVVLTTAIFIWSACNLGRLHTPPVDIFLAYLTALTIAVPPGLIACLSVATSISIARLNELHFITVSETSRVNYAGTVSFACFDKTGTLTDENIEFKGMALVHQFDTAAAAASVEEICHELMATCHGMSMLDGRAVGDPLEVELLRASGWSLQSSNNSELKVVNPSSPNTYCTIVRHFEFTPE